MSEINNALSDEQKQQVIHRINTQIKFLEELADESSFFHVVSEQLVEDLEFIRLKLSRRT